MMFDYEMERAKAMQAMTQAQIAEQQRQLLPAMKNYQPTLADMLAAQNYRPPVYVPEGWAYWSDNSAALEP